MIRVEIEVDQQLERGDRRRFELGDGHQDLFLEFGREELQ